MSDQIRFIVQPGGMLRGKIRIPGDKSISHRAIIFGAIAEGLTIITGFLEGEDALATLNAFRLMGVNIDGPEQGRVSISGVGIRGLSSPDQPLNLGNSGTSMRLLSGLLSGQQFDSVLVGDASLSKRPMTRIIKPLTKMAVDIRATEAGTAPLKIRGGSVLKGITYEMPMASAQVKSCLLLAGLYGEGKTCVIEPAPTRDHTERMLESFGYPVERVGNRVSIVGGERLIATDLDIPGDISSAAFFMVGATIAADSEIVLEHVGLNPTRAGVIEILRLMGAKLVVENQRTIGGEPVADIRVQSSQLKGITIPAHLVPLAIDEFPALFIAAACAEGQTLLTGAEELRVKESDRIQVMADGLKNVGIDANPTADGICIQGGKILGGTVNSSGDHRIAMAFAIAGLIAETSIEILDCKNVDTSFPGFLEISSRMGLGISGQ